MKILITAGGTSEKIDDVRKITNMATGRLGALTAEEFMKKSEAEIVYVCSENAVVPTGASVEVIKVESVEDLMNTLTRLLAKNTFDVVVHTMAVSDYAVRGVATLDSLSSAIAKAVYENSCLPDNLDGLSDIISAAILNDSEIMDNRRKISSDMDSLIIFMDKTPKVINSIKQMQPETILVGFKLLVGVSEDTLLHKGHELLVKNKCDFVLANDLERIHGDIHEGILIEPDRSYRRMYSKQEIANVITDRTLAKIREIRI